MQNKKINLKFLINTLITLVFFINVQSLLAQTDNDSYKIKIDGLAAVVGDFVILDSDIDKTIIDLQSQGVNTVDLDRCSLLGKLMEDKLYAHHAEQDSLEIHSQQIYNYVYQTIDYFINQLRDIDKVLVLYKKQDE